MGWLAAGVLYSLTYLLVGWWLREQLVALVYLRAAALLVPPLLAVIVIVRRRHLWAGCQWLFWATVVLGLMISAIGLVGWTIDAIQLARGTSWLGWYAVFLLFGGLPHCLPSSPSRIGAVANVPRRQRPWTSRGSPC